MNLPILLGGAGALIVGYALLTGKKLVLGNNGPMVVQDVGNGGYLIPPAAEAFTAMVAAAAQDGIRLTAGSAFRSVVEQAGLYAQYVARRFTPPIVAKPGTSNHGLGIAVDIATSPGVSVHYGTAAFTWLQANAGNYGFSWAEGKAVNEPWHWVWVG